MIRNKFKIAIFNERMLQGHGVDVVVDLLAESLVNSGFEVTVCVLFTDFSYSNRKYKLRVLKKFRRTFLTRVIRKFISDMAARDLEFYFNRNEIKAIHADLLIINSYPFFPALLFTKKPCIVIDYGVASSRYLSLRHKVNRLYLSFSQKYLFFENAKKILTISEYLKNKLPKFLRAKARTVHLGADTYAGYPVSAEQIHLIRKRFGVEDNDFLMVYVGRANMQTRTYKDLHELLEIYKEVRSENPKIKLAVVGYGTDDDKKVLEANDAISLLNTPEEKMALIYSSCNLYVTATKWEGFDLPLAEAQFFGKPAVAYNIGPHPELCKNNESGFLVDSKDEFVKRIIEIASNPSLQKTLSEKAKTQSLRFTWEKTVAGFIAAVEEVLYEQKSRLYKTLRLTKNINPAKI